MPMDWGQIVNLNPWWKDGSLINNDMKIREYCNSPVPWLPQLISDFNLVDDRIYVLRGPRQVGKSTLMKLMIRQLLGMKTIEKDGTKIIDYDEDGHNADVDLEIPLAVISPQNILYLTCDILIGHKELVEIVESFLEYSRRFKSSERKYLFIDEISQVKSWEKGVKFLADAGILENTTLILTGSHTLDLKYSTERLPGRRGEGGGNLLNKIMTPLKFSEYVMTVRPEMQKGLSGLCTLNITQRARKVLEFCHGEIDHGVLDELRLYQTELRSLLASYLVSGGIIRAINELHSNNTIEPSTYEIYVRSLLGDLARWNYQETTIKQVLRSLVGKMTTSISFHSIAKENEIGSHATVSNYLQALEHSMLINTFYRLDLHRQRPAVRSSRKVYFSDPFIFHAIRGWLQGNIDYYGKSRQLTESSESVGKLVEMVVADHIIHLARTLNPSDVFSHHERTYYFRKKGKDREVDFVLHHNGKMYPFEVKYQNSISNRDVSGLFSFGNGLVLSKKTMDLDKRFPVIPVESFLMLI